MKSRLLRGAAVLAAAALALQAFAAQATPSLVVDVQSGQVISSTDATERWYPASLTKLMTVYVALTAVKAGRLTMDTPLVVSARADRMPASRMGFRVGQEVTLDNALKMLMVHSPNDVAVTVAEGVSGSVEAFADEMNAAAARLGLHESHFVNPNGLHDPNHYSSARDMAMVARALIQDFPEDSDLFSIQGFSLDDRVYPNHNALLGRYSGADGMKTGFTCAAGFNLVASATRNGRRLIAVALGYPSGRTRNDHVANMLDQGFAAWGGSGATLDALPSTPGPAHDMRSQICSARNRAAILQAEAEDASKPADIFTAIAGGGPSPPISATTPAPFDPVPVFIGRKEGWTGVALGPRKPDAPLIADEASDKAANVAAGTGADGAEAKPKGASAPLALTGSPKSLADAALPPAIKGVKPQARKSKKKPTPEPTPAPSQKIDEGN